MDEIIEEKDLAVNRIPVPERETKTSGNTGPNESEKAVPRDPVPKEDWSAWLQVWGAFCLNLNTWGLMNAYGVYQTFYELNLLSTQSSSNISWIGSVQAFLMFLISILAGLIFDAGHLKSLLWSGTLLTVVGMFITSICQTYWQCFLAQGAMVGLGLGCLYLPAPAVISQHFEAKISLAMGIASTGSAVGGVIYPIIFTRIQSAIGFGWATRVIAFIILGTSLIPLATMRRRTSATVHRSLIDLSAFRDVPYIVFNFGLLFGFMGLYIIFYYVQLYALLEGGVASALAPYTLVVVNASSCFGRVIPGFYADKVGSINVQTIVAFISASLTFCLIAIRNMPGLIVYSVLYGLFAGAFMGLPGAGVARLSSDRSKIGIRLGMTLAFVGFGVLVSNPIAGAILGAERNWVGLILWCGSLLATAGASMVASRITKVGTRLATII